MAFDGPRPALEGDEVVVRFEIRIVLSHHEEATERSPKILLGLQAHCWVAVDRPSPSSKTKPDCFLCFFGFGTGETNSARRRVSMIRWVGCPSLSSSQWREG